MSADDIPDSELPESYDFSNIAVYDFIGPVRDQGACGSCYTVSFTQVIESRLKLKYGKEIPQLSTQYLNECNYMNEGWLFLALRRRSPKVSDCSPAKREREPCFDRHETS